MKEDFFSRNKILFYFSFLIITVITFFPLLFTGFATADDLQNFILSHKDEIWTGSRTFAKYSGRFYYYFVQPVHYLPYLTENIFVVKLFQLIPLIICFLLFAKILLFYCKSELFSWLFFLIFLLICQVSGHTSLFVSYPFYFPFSFSLLLISFILLLQYFSDNKKSRIIYSALLFAGGLLFYEAYVLYLFFIILAIVDFHYSGNFSKPVKIKKSFIDFLPYLTVATIYFLIYFLFQSYYPSQYPGTRFVTHGPDLKSFFQVIWNLSYTSFPLTVFQTSQDLFNYKSDWITGYFPIVSEIIAHARVEWLVKGVFIAFCGYFLLNGMPGITGRKFLKWSFIAILLIVIPQVPMAFSEKYIFYVVQTKMIGYVTTYFSLFGTVLLICLVLRYLMSLISFQLIIKKAIAILLVCGFFICSVLTDFSNAAIAKDIRGANIRFYAMDELIKSDEFLSIPPYSGFFAKELYSNPFYSAGGLTEQSFNWSDYIWAKAGISQQIFRDEKAMIDFSKKYQTSFYYLTMQQALKGEELCLILAKVNPAEASDTAINPVSNRIYIVYYSPYKTFSVSFKCKKDSVLKNEHLQVNHIKDEFNPAGIVEFTIYNTHKDHAATTFSIEVDAIDLESILISNLINPGNKVFYL